MKKLDATPFPAAAVSHEIPMTMLERMLVLKLLAELAGKTREQVKQRKEAFEAIEGLKSTEPMDFETYGPKGVEVAEFEKTAKIAVTKPIIRTIAAIYDESLTAGLLAGKHTFDVGELVDRLEWTLTATVDA